MMLKKRERNQQTVTATTVKTTITTATANKWRLFLFQNYFSPSI